MHGIGDRFQQDTKYLRDKLPAGDLDWAIRPEPYKRYAEKPRVALPKLSTHGGPPVWEILLRRRSIRDFVTAPLSLSHVSRLLWAAQGVTAEHFGYKFRTAPSAGALYPIETYLIVNRVDEVPSGIYHYAVEEHALEELKKGDFRVSIERAALDQKVAYEAGLVFIWTAIFQRCTWKYRQRAYRYIYMDVGHIAQNVALAAVALELGSCQIAALYDEEVNELIGIDGIEESTVYLTVVGKPA